MLAFGTGMLPLNSLLTKTSPPKRKLRLRGSRSALPLINISLALGYTHFDTSEVYPGFAELGRSLRPLRHTLFVTSKVDPTVGRARAKCAAPLDRGGCEAAVLQAANATRARLGFAPDVLLMHRPPSRWGGEQCARLRASWRGLEAAQRRGLARAIGLSNVCGPLLRCLARTAVIKPAVLQYMGHVGMGRDPFGYAAFGRREWGAVPMAYSVLGGAEQDFAKITSAPAVARVAAAHGTHAASVAVSWAAQQGTPLVLISAKPGHLRDNLRAVAGEPPWGRLSAREMEELSALREPGGRPSFWADCDDAPVPPPGHDGDAMGDAPSVRRDARIGVDADNFVP